MYGCDQLQQSPSGSSERCGGAVREGTVIFGNLVTPWNFILDSVNNVVIWCCVRFTQVVHSRGLVDRGLIVVIVIIMNI